ncbi:MAG TPA: protein TolQ [Gammaproteobacteria bacterium]|jgi:biopolymer transport protein TolQ
MTGEFSVIDLIWNASFVVQLVMLLLLLASIASWAVIIDKRKLLKQAVDDADEFEQSFWSGIDLTKFYRDIAEGTRTALGMAGIFKAGYSEFGRLREESGMSSGALVQGAQRAMNVTQMREVDRLEQNLAFLATVASTSPYVGLFGTVWGIMSAFYSLQGAQSVTIALVAGPISEALIATAMGLFAAIPAQIAYNRYADQVDRLEVRYDTFTEELSSILERSAVRRAKASAGTAG